MVMNKVSVRKAVVDDLNAIGNLWQEFMDFHPYLTTVFKNI